jgi:cytochrome b561
LSKKEKPSAITMLLITVISLGIVLANSSKNGSELFFLFAPIAAITSNYIESGLSKRRRIFNELFVWSLVTLVLLLAILQLM